MTVRVVLFLAAITAIICAKSIVGESLHYGSVVRIKAETASHYLHSHKVPIEPEGPYSTTGFWGDDDANSLWSLQQPYSAISFSQKTYQDPILCGENVTLIHSLTGGSLQTFEGSIGLTIPEQLVTNSPQPLESNNNWRIECEGKELRFGDSFRLQHSNSGRYLRISKEFFYDQINCGRGCAIMNHLEVHAVREKSDETSLVAVDGITFV